jgi:hypothetical protein
MPSPGSLASILGAPDSGAETEDDGDSMASDFESAAVDAFPELEGKPDRIAALKQCIQCCMGADTDSDY